MKKITHVFLIVISLTGSSVSAQNLMTNGSFENFLPPCPLNAPNGAFNQVLDWKPANDIPGLGTPHAELYCGEPNYGGCLPGPVPNVGSDGIAYVGFHTRIFTPPYNESIYQVLANPLVTGNTYTISFDLMDCQSGFFITGPSDFCVYTNVDTIIPACPPDNPSVTLVGCIPFDSISNTAWKHHEFTFVAPPNSNIIAFSGGACNVSEVYYYLDNVVLTTQAISVAFISTDNHLCPGACTQFTNLSVNATAYEWTFAGANPSTSTDISPSNICYSLPGTYGVTLVASNGNTSDTLTLNNYITVYPFPAPQGISQSGDTLFANQGAVAYQWYYGGIAIPGATDYFYVATESGDYNVVASDANGCEVEAAIFDVIAGMAGSLSGMPDTRLFVFPNPARNKINVVVPGISGNVDLSRLKIKCFNVIGETVSATPQTFQRDKDSPTGAAFTLDLNQPVPGVYALEITLGGIVYRSKVIIQN